MDKWGNLAALKRQDEQKTGYLSTMALSSFLNYSSSPSHRTGLLFLVELIRLAGDKTEGWNENWTKNWNDEVGLAGVSGLGIRPGR